MRRLFVLFTVAAFSVSIAAPASAARAVSASVVRRALSRGSAPITLPVAGGESVTLRLRPTSILAPNVAFSTTDAHGVVRPAPREPFITTTGRIDSDRSSLVRLTVSGNAVAGIIRYRGTWFSVEPDNWNAPRRTRVTQVTSQAHAIAASLEGDTIGEASTAHGTQGSQPGSVAPPVPPVGVGLLNCIAFACDRLTTTVLLDGDNAFRTSSPSTCQSRQAAIFNGVNGVVGIFDDASTKIDLTVSQINCRTTSDLGSAANPMVDYLIALRNFWNGNQQIDRSTVLLSSGLNFGAMDVIGVAYVPGVCSRIVAPVITGATFPQTCADGYGMLQTVARPLTNYTASSFLQIKLAAHEVGHNFNAQHDTGAACKTAAPRNGPIMCSIIQEVGPQTFSSVSAAAIRDHAENKIGSATGT